MLEAWFKSGEPEQLGQNGQAYIVNYHNLNTVIEQYKELFMQARAKATR
jgi:uncharacterized protein YukE